MVSLDIGSCVRCGKRLVATRRSFRMRMKVPCKCGAENRVVLREDEYREMLAEEARLSGIVQGGDAIIGRAG